jgi:hypothetical protein
MLLQLLLREREREREGEVFVYARMVARKKEEGV